MCMSPSLSYSSTLCPGDCGESSCGCVESEGVMESVGGAGRGGGTLLVALARPSVSSLLTCLLHMENGIHY